jgi:hypothetical protein
MGSNTRGRAAAAILTGVMVTAIVFVGYRFSSGAAARTPDATGSSAPSSAPAIKRLEKAQARQAIKAAVARLPGAKAVRGNTDASPRVLSPAACAEKLNNPDTDPAEVATSTYRIPQESEPDLKVTFTIGVRSGGTPDDAADLAAEMAELFPVCDEYVVDAGERRDIYRLSTYSADLPPTVRPLFQLRVEAQRETPVGAISRTVVAGNGPNSMTVGWTYAYHGAEPTDLTAKLDRTSLEMLLAGVAELP